MAAPFNDIAASARSAPCARSSSPVARSSAAPPAPAAAVPASGLLSPASPSQREKASPACDCRRAVCSDQRLHEQQPAPGLSHCRVEH